ncbi:MAG: O-antigen ligase family protein [Solirubrobacterales bacterium]
MASIPTDNRIAAVLIGATMLGLWTWWALGEGAFFGTVLLPGAIVAYLVLIVVVLFARLPISPHGLHVLALTALLALAAWTAVSIVWSPAPDLAADYAQRTAVYAACFALGLTLVVSLRRRMLLSIAPLLGAGAITALTVLVAIWTGDDVKQLVDLDGTLDFPFGYRNADAAFFVLVAVASLPLLARPRTPPPLRAVLAALAATSLALATISQSRGSLLALAAGLLVVVLAGPNRVRTTVAIVIAVAPVAIVFSHLLAPFDAAGTPSALSELQKGATAAAAAGVLGAAISATVSAIEWQGRDVRVRRPDKRKSLIALGIAAVIAVGLLIAVIGNPVSAVKDRFGSPASSGESYTPVEGSRFTYSGGLNRIDFWGVAVGQALDNPVAGGGAGSFRSAYLLEGDGSEEPRNAHSLPLEMLGELGFVGLFLVCLAFVAGVGGALRSRRLGPESAVLSATAMAVTAALVAQSAVDWSWFFGALFAPAFALLGSACAPATLVFKPLAPRIRGMAAAVAGVLALIAVPAFASERLTLDAAEAWRSDPEGAFTALGNAAALNPLADTPLLVESEIARLAGDDARAVDAARRASDRAPDDWRGYMLAARALANSDRDAALAALDRAQELNPNSESVADLRRRLNGTGGDSSSDSG